MDKLCTLIEKIDGKREIRYSGDRIMPNYFIREWHFVYLTTEKIDELEEATMERVQELLKNL